MSSLSFHSCPRCAHAMCSRGRTPSREALTSPRSVGRSVGRQSSANPSFPFAPPNKIPPGCVNSCLRVRRFETRDERTGKKFWTNRKRRQTFFFRKKDRIVCLVAGCYFFFATVLSLFYTSRLLTFYRRIDPRRPLLAVSPGSSLSRLQFLQRSTKEIFAKKKVRKNGTFPSGG